MNLASELGQSREREKDGSRQGFVDKMKVRADKRLRLRVWKRELIETDRRANELLTRVMKSKYVTKDSANK